MATSGRARASASTSTAWRRGQTPRSPIDPAQAPRCEPVEELPFERAEKQSQRTGDTMLLTEFGATDDLGADRAHGRAGSDANMVGWQYWHYCQCEDPTTTGAGPTQALVVDPAPPPTGDNVKRGQARRARPALPRGRGGHAARLGLRPRHAPLRPELLHRPSRRWRLPLRRRHPGLRGRRALRARLRRQRARAARPSRHATPPALRVRTCAGRGSVASGGHPGDAGAAARTAAPVAARLAATRAAGAAARRA